MITISTGLVDVGIWIWTCSRYSVFMNMVVNSTITGGLSARLLRVIQQFPYNRIYPLHLFENFLLLFKLIRLCRCLAHQLNKQGDGVERISNLVSNASCKRPHSRERFRAGILFMGIHS